jgi:hypothetical protein
MFRGIGHVELALTVMASLFSGCGNAVVGVGNDAGGGDAKEAGRCVDATAPRFDPGTSACKDDKPLVIGGTKTGFSTCSGPSSSSPTLHRSAVMTCPNLLVEATKDSCSDPSGTCTSAADCADAGPVAACILDDSAIAGYCDCRAGCVKDSDCPAHEICQCASPIGECVAASCTSDAQCGPGLLCANSSGVPGVSGSGTFICQTPQDKCLTDDDCPGACDLGVSCSMSCALNTKGIRECQETCGSPGP